MSTHSSEGPSSHSGVGALVRSKPSLFRRVLVALNPIDIIRGIPGAVFQKEIQVSGRKRGTYYVRAISTLILAALLGLIVASTFFDSFDGSSTGASALQEYQSVAPAILFMVAWCQFIGLSLTSLARNGAAISDERRMGTLAALLTTPLRSWQIVLGKLLGNLVEIAILGLVATPLLLAIRTFGGVSASSIVHVALLSVLHAVLAGVLGLLFSVNARKSSSASLIAFLALVILQIGPPFALWAIDDGLQELGTSLRQQIGINFDPAGSIFVTCTPVALAFGLYSSMGVATPLPAGVTGSFLWMNALYLAGLSVFFFFVTSAMLRKRLSKEAAGGAASTATKETTVVAAPEPVAELSEAAPATVAPVKPARARAASTIVLKPRIVDDDPVLWRELSQPALSRSGGRRFGSATSIGSIGAISLFLLFIYYRVGLDETPLHMIIGVVGTIAAIAIAAMSTTSGISGERESRTLESLLTTPLTARDIVLGKFLGALRRQWIVPAFIGFHFAVPGLLSGHVGISAILLGAPVLLPAITMLAASGVLCSCLFKKSSSASTANFGFGVILWIAIPALFGIFRSISQLSGLNDVLEAGVATALCVNPVPMMVLVIGGAVGEGEMLRGGEYFLFGIWRVPQWGFALIVLTAGLVQLAVAAACLKLAVFSLARSSLRRA